MLLNRELSQNIKMRFNEWKTYNSHICSLLIEYAQKGFIKDGQGRSNIISMPNSENEGFLGTKKNQKIEFFDGSLLKFKETTKIEDSNLIVQYYSFQFESNTRFTIRFDKTKETSNLPLKKMSTHLHVALDKPYYPSLVVSCEFFLKWIKTFLCDNDIRERLYGDHIEPTTFLADNYL